jgi:RNA polymerase sigma-70 factor (ECF subfamily)
MTLWRPCLVAVHSLATEPARVRRRLAVDDKMHGYVDRLAGGIERVDDDLEREFESRLVESGTLAFRVAYGVLRQRQDAEDVAQEAFVKAHRSFRQLRDANKFRAWLVRMTWRLALDRQRSDRRRTARETGHAEAMPDAISVDEPVARERAAALWQAIDALPDKLRVVVVLAGIEGHDIRRVADLLELPEGTVKSRLFTARQQLRERLQWMIGIR